MTFTPVAAKMPGMTSAVQYELADGVGAITLDDGKANVLTLDVFAAIHDAIDRAEADGAAIVFAGRPERFCAGFDIKVLSGGGPDAPDLLRAGFETSYRLLAHPRPVVIACTGHAYAMGAFLLLSGDHRIGVAGADHRITANEVAIGLTMPHTAIEICRQRLTRAHFERAVLLSEVFTPETAVAAGFLDELVAPGELLDAARAKASALLGLHLGALAATKARTRAATLEAMRQAIERDDAEFRSMLG